MYQFARKIHLWVGLVLASVFLIQAITGLLLAEPWLVGQGQQQIPPREQALNIEQNEVPESKGPVSQGEERMLEGAKPIPGGAFGLAKGLHQGKVGNLDLKWVVDFSAIGLVILTLTGVYLAIPILRMRNRKK